MAKKRVRKKSSKKKRVSKKKRNIPVIKKPRIPKDDAKLERVLIENFVALQKVMVNLSVKFDDLTNKISKLLELFEISAKALAEKDLTLEKTSRDDEKIVKKIDNLSEQNKIIARGLSFMHERLSGEAEHPAEEPFQQFAPMPPKMPPRQRPMPMPGKSVVPAQSMEGYQKSIASEKPPEFKKLPT